MAPLWAALFALVGELAGRPIGQPHAIFYAYPEAFIDVLRGDNLDAGLGYKARKAWDACTGLGLPKAGAISKLFSPKATA